MNTNQEEMITKLYLVCEDIDLGYHVYGAYDDKKYAEAKMNECIEVAWRMRLIGNEEDIPEEFNIQECDPYHKYFIDVIELNSDKGIAENNDWKIKLTQQRIEEKKTQKSLQEELKCSYACAGDIMYLHKCTRWTQELENKLIELHNAGTPPNIWDFSWIDT
jgi:hypothetical protein